ncbi:hypothetical protein L226DRAFT_566050 [Lentinus tigrinus ALCF2SS1-7]|uniref:uncharacterized protein n=1 Tax=Lentinus tigrinus ALCF2SS1-7 TaxID=1328758 RepID=UPI0011663A46|nr:hypothetical protein L226DRAFT_566050 [Lentinus tigrinus ALCF2SS1-7]
MSSHRGYSSDSSSASASSTSIIAAAASSTTTKTAGHSGGGSGKRTTDHPEYVWYGLLALLGLATFVNACYLSWVTYRRYRARRRASEGSSTSRTVAPPGETGRLSLRRIPQAVLSASRIFGFRWRIPGLDLMVVEVFFTVAYMLACLVWCFAPVDGLTYPTNIAGRSWGSRTGKLATVQLPFIVLLSMKNNAVTWLTGIGHEKLNLMHRVVSRCVLLLTWLHFGGIPAKLLDEGWKVAGMVGAVAQTITTIISVKWFRRRFYETFYVSHVILILIFLVTVHVHVVPVRCAKYIWGVWAIWLFDRLLRGGRYILLNLVLRPSNAKARIEAIGADGLRITLRRRIAGGWRAGQHVFLAFPTLGLQSHPFTIGNVYDPLPRADNKSKGEDKEEAEMVFLVRAMKGQTRTLLERAAPTGSCELPAMVDGPYGHPEDIRPFSTCVFIAGGTGVTYTLARMHQLFRDVNASDACAQRVVFVWTIRTQTEYEWMAADLENVLAEAPPAVSLAVDIYLTGGSATGDPNSDSDADADPRLESLPTLARDFHADAGMDIEKGTGTGTDEGHDSDAKNRPASSASASSSSDSGCSTPATPSTPSTPGTLVSCGDVKKPDAAYFAPCAGRAIQTPTPTECCRAFPLAVAVADAITARVVRRRCGRADVYGILEEEVGAARGAVAVDVSGPDALVDGVRRALCAPFAGPVAALRGTPTVMLSVEQFRM